MKNAVWFKLSISLFAVWLLILPPFVYSNGNDPAAAKLFREAELLFDKANYSQALEKYQAASKIYKKGENWEPYFEAQSGEIECHLRLENTETLMAMIGPTKEACARQLGARHPVLGNLYYLDAVMDTRLRNGEQTPALVAKALEILIPAKGKDCKEVANCYNLLGNYWQSKRDYDQAQEYYTESLNIKLKVFGPAHPTVGISYNNLGIVYMQRGDFEMAIEYYQKSLAVKIKQYGEKHPRVSDTYFNIGHLYFQTGENKKAIVYFEKAIQIDKLNEETQNRKLAHRYTSLSEAYFHENRFDLAIGYGKLAIENYEKIDINPEFSATAYQNLGTIYQSAKDYPTAFPYYQKALSALSASNLEPASFDNPAVEIWNASERGYQILFEKMKTLEAWYLQSPQDFKLEAALQTAEALIKTTEAIQQNMEGESSKFLFLENSRLAFEKALGFCHQLFEKTGDGKYLAQALTIYEQGKSVLLRNSLQNERAKTVAEMPDSVRQQISSLKVAIGELAMQVKAAKNEAEKATLQSSLFDKKRSFQLVLRELEKDFPKYCQIKDQAVAFSPSGLQKILGAKNETLMAWFVGEAQIFIFKISAQQIDFEKIGKPGGFEAGIIAFATLLNDKTLAANKGNSPAVYQDFIRRSSTIYQQLFPVELPGSSSMILIPDGALNLLPFELLLTESPKPGSGADYAGLPYLVKKAAIRYAYSPSFLLGNDQRKTSDKARMLAFAPTYGSGHAQLLATRGDYAHLAFSQKEVSSIHELFDSKLQIGALATKENFSALAGEYRFLHLAMHAMSNAESPAQSGLIFSEAPGEANSILYAFEVANLDLSAQLAVLSACNTGAGKLAAGEGLISLARAFRQAGCPNIVMSLWEADDEATAFIMEAFYKNLKAGLGKAEALRQAKLGYLQQDRKTFPFYWASFVLTGDNEKIDVGHPGRWWLGAGLALMLLAVVVNRKRIRKLARFLPRQAIYKGASS